MVTVTNMIQFVAVVCVTIGVYLFEMAKSYPRATGWVVGLYALYIYGTYLVRWLSSVALDSVLRLLSWLFTALLGLWIALNETTYGELLKSWDWKTVEAIKTTLPPVPYMVPYVKMPWRKVARRLGFFELNWLRLRKAWAIRDLIYLAGVFVVTVMVSLLIVLALYQAIKLMVRFFRCLSRVWLFWRSRVYMDLGFVNTFSEKMMVGSNFELNTPLPKIQCEVWVSFEKRPFQLAGQAWRLDNYLVTAWHNVSDADAVRLKSGDITVDVPYEKGFENVEGDIACYLPDPRDLNKLGLQQAKLSSVGSQKVLARVVALGKMSMGFAKPYDAFGYLQYDGSTVPGFSGAPYMLNEKVVVGMHIGGMTVNVGYDVNYLKMLMRKKTKESSSDFIKSEADKAQMVIRKSAFNPDEYDVEVRGRRGERQYYRMDEEELDKWNSKWRDADVDYATGELYLNPYKAGRGKRSKGLSYDEESRYDVFATKNGNVLMKRETAVVLEDTPQQVQNMQLQDQGNFLNPGVDVPAPGSQNPQEPNVQHLGQPSSSEMIKSEVPTSTNMAPQISTPAAQNDPSPLMSTLQQLIGELRASPKERSQLLRSLCDLTNGDLVPESRDGTSKNGSKKSSRGG